MKIKVLVVDDSALIRNLMTQIIRSHLDLNLVGVAPNAFVAKDMVNQFSPDVITLDIEMPKVDGLVFLDRLMKARPTPVIMISTLTQDGAEATLRSLELGAVDFMAKPSFDVVNGINLYAELIVEKIRAAAQAKVRRAHQRSGMPLSSLAYGTTKPIIAIGASTGGTEAIRQLLERFPENAPCVIISQHLPPGFTASFAKRLDRMTALTVTEAQGGETIAPGKVFLAPGDKHLTVVRKGNDYVTQLDDSERVCGHKPSVDVMFDSLASSAGNRVIAILLTGMGKDGGLGMQKIHQQGGFTIAQNEASCVVFGMPKEAIRLEAVDLILDLDDMLTPIFTQVKTLSSL